MIALTATTNASASAGPRQSPAGLRLGARTTRVSHSHDTAPAPAPTASGLTIVPTYNACPAYPPTTCEPVTSDPDASEIENAIGYVIDQFEALYSNPITIYLHFYMTPTESEVGESDVYLTSAQTYASVRNALIAKATTPDQVTADNSLPSTDPTDGGSFELPLAEGKALGMVPANEVEDDGDVYFSSEDSFTFDPNNRAVAGDIDFIGLAEHEISEAIGRSYGLGQGGLYMPNDLFRYTGSGQRNLTAWTPGTYFSINGGVTNLVTFNSDSDGDPQDYVTSSPDAFDANATVGVEMPLTEVGLTNMDVLGFNRPVASLSLSPSTQDIAAGNAQTYSAEGYDALGDDMGSVTGSTSFTIAPDGSGSAQGASCSGTSCTASVPGAYLVTGTDGSATGTTILYVGFAVATTSLPAATPGGAYGPVTLATVGAGTSASGHSTTFRWSPGKVHHPATALPKGLKLSKAGLLSGTPSPALAAGTSSVTVKVTETVTTLKGKKKVKKKTTVQATIPLTIN